MLQFADRLGAVEGGTAYNGIASLNNSISSWLNPGHG